MKDNEMDVLTNLWNVYFYHLNRALNMHETQEMGHCYCTTILLEQAYHLL
jgi:hypothetical protein